MPVRRTSSRAALGVAGEVDLLVGDAALGQERLRGPAIPTGLSRVHSHPPHYFSKCRRYPLAGSLKTEGIVLRSMRYGEADRILHLYTPQRGRVSAIAKGVRRAKSRFGGRLEPFFRLAARALRGPQRPADRHLGRDARRPPRACARTARRSTPRRAPATPSGGCSTTATRTRASTTCSPTSSRCSTPRPSGPAAPTRSPSASSCCSPPASRPQLSACASCGEREHLAGLLRRRRRRGLQRLRGGRVRARPRRPRLPRRRPRPPARRHAGGRAARARPGGARDQRDGRAPRARRGWRLACA